MKISSLLILFYIGSIYTMDVPQTPTKKRTPLSPLSKNTEVFTPTSKKVRLDMLKAITGAVDGVIVDENLDPEDLDEGIATASPRTFLKKTHTVFTDLIIEEFAQQGVTPDLVKKYLSPAKHGIRDLADATDRLLSPASSPFKRAGEEVARRLGQPLQFRKSESGIEAYLNDDQVVLDEKLLSAYASSPTSIRVVAGHETGHYIHQDQVERIAYSDASKQVAATPTPELEELQKKQCRKQETFADLTPILLSPSLAKSSIAMFDRFIAQEGAGTSEEYPDNFKRRNLATAGHAFQQQHTKEKERAVRRSLLEDMEHASKEVVARRPLIEDLEEAASEAPMIPRTKQFHL